MAHQRTTSVIDGTKEPHSVSLKVLRLSRPSLSIQHPLPTPSPSPSPDSSSIPLAPHPSASLAYPTTSSSSSSTAPDPFILSPLLTLPPAFGSAYVGEMFACTLCANNELLFNSSNGSGTDPSSRMGATTAGDTVTPSKIVSNITIEAEMKIPSSSVPVKLELESASSTATSPPPSSPPEQADPPPTTNPSQTIQRTLTFPLLEEGSHILAITVSYTETITTLTSISSRVRTFRKLYQFVCKACLVVRTKARELSLSLTSTSSPAGGKDTKKITEGEIGPEQKGRAGNRGKKWLLEAQLENSSDETIILEAVILECLPGIHATSFNWERDPILERPVLRPTDVLQVGFMVEEDVGDGDRGEEEEKRMEPVDGKWIFGALSLSWRGAMGSRGVLSTGRLGARVT